MKEDATVHPYTFVKGKKIENDPFIMCLVELRVEGRKASQKIIEKFRISYRCGSGWLLFWKTPNFSRQSPKIVLCYDWRPLVVIIIEKGARLKRQIFEIEYNISGISKHVEKEWVFWGY